MRSARRCRESVDPLLTWSVRWVIPRWIRSCLSREGAESRDVTGEPVFGSDSAVRAGEAHERVVSGWSVDLLSDERFGGDGRSLRRISIPPFVADFHICLESIDCSRV